MKNGFIITPTSKPTATVAINTYEIEGLSLNSTSITDEGHYMCVILTNGAIHSSSQGVDLLLNIGKFFLNYKIIFKSFMSLLEDTKVLQPLNLKEYFLSFLKKLKIKLILNLNC